LDTPEAAAQAAAQQALEGDSLVPLVDAAELLIAAVLDHPEWAELLDRISNAELDAIAARIPDGYAARLLRSRTA